MCGSVGAYSYTRVQDRQTPSMGTARCAGTVLCAAPLPAAIRLGTARCAGTVPWFRGSVVLWFYTIRCGAVASRA
jgi:hypothetical protein